MRTHILFTLGWLILFLSMVHCHGTGYARDVTFHWGYPFPGEEKYNALVDRFDISRGEKEPVILGIPVTVRSVTYGTDQTSDNICHVYYITASVKTVSSDPSNKIVVCNNFERLRITNITFKER